MKCGKFNLLKWKTLKKIKISTNSEKLLHCGKNEKCLSQHLSLVNSNDGIYGECNAIYDDWIDQQQI